VRELFSARRGSCSAWISRTKALKPLPNKASRSGSCSAWISPFIHRLFVDNCLAGVVQRTVTHQPAPGVVQRTARELFSASRVGRLRELFSVSRRPVGPIKHCYGKKSRLTPGVVQRTSGWLRELFSASKQVLLYGFVREYVRAGRNQDQALFVDFNLGVRIHNQNKFQRPQKRLPEVPHGLV
jgi:hypothetical protein